MQLVMWGLLITAAAPGSSWAPKIAAPIAFAGLAPPARAGGPVNFEGLAPTVEVAKPAPKAEPPRYEWLRDPRDPRVLLWGYRDPRTGQFLWVSRHDRDGGRLP